MKEKKLTFKKQATAFVTAGFGQNLLVAFKNLFLTEYLSRLGFSSSIYATVLFVLTLAHLFDAFNDPLMGVIIDKTNTRWGKLRPYIMISALPMIILTILVFSVPNVGTSGQLAFFFIVYFVWEITYTVCDVSYWGLASAISKLHKQRTAMISIARGVATIGVGLVAITGLLIVDSIGWTMAATLISIFGMGLFLLAFFFTRETPRQNVKEVGLKDMFKNLLTNKPLLLVVISSIISFGRSIIQTNGAFFATRAYEDGGLAYMFLSGGLIFGMVIANFTTSLMLRKFTKKMLYIYSTIASIIIHIVLFFIGYANVWVFASMMLFNGLTLGWFVSLQTTMIADAVDYSENKTGIRNEGMAFSSLTFVSKLMVALATALSAIFILILNYDPATTASKTVLDGYFISLTIVPAVSCLLSLIPIFFYKLSDKELDEIHQKRTQEMQKEDNEILNNSNII